ncbi:glucose/arabinose dehydrogenase [Friedmanniella endophytica]|uniref:Glucose/arabinose dehydrogenase n=1 Tax=Microlunatus kandeliicorticis TaxID=1759536 RepID=A0A7W3IT54_9ACTN|nr:PQQ-dependent sugar dehydrogenase [Microlunatus kandeliicorticis]MBA8794784.1 glucose/arabinose dehydrogenase [Microlunatus kandeliicorticis]
MSATPLSLPAVVIMVRRTSRRLRLTVLLMISALVASSSLVAGPVSSASADTGSSATGTVVGVTSGRCLDVYGNRTTFGTRVDLYSCSGHANQLWTFTAAGELRVYAPARCLDVVDHDVTSPAAVQIYGCTGNANQRWRLNADGTITGVESGLCLEPTTATTNGTAVRMATCNHQPSQQWRFPKLADRQPPTAPGAPTTSKLTCTSVVLGWTAATDDRGVTGYDVYHDGQLLTSVGGSTLSTTLTVLPGVSWDLYVTARDAAGNVSQSSPTVSLSPPACGVDTTPPSTPTGLRASVSGTDVTLTWTAATDDVGVTGYDVYRNGTKVGAVNGAILDDGSTVRPLTTFLDATGARSTAFSWTVAARDARGNISPRSGSVTATTGSSCSTLCTVTTVATDDDLPWGLVQLPDGTVLYSRRDHHDVIRVDPTTGAKTTLGTVPNVLAADGSGGLYGIAIAPTFASDHWLYLMQTSPTDVRVVRIRITSGTLDLSSEQVVVKGILRNRSHNGGRLRFGPDGKLYVATGDAENGATAQDLSGLNGKILRVNPDGSIPADNPFGTAVWSYGHRNPQGLAFDSQGRLWEQEFGNSIMDETNLIVRGGNYGWPQCEGTSGACSGAGLIAPKQTYPTPDASCSGLAIVADVVYIGCERGIRLYREVISGDRLTDVRSYYVGTFGRLRTVEPARDGGLWLTTTNDGDADSTTGTAAEKIIHVTLGSPSGQL